MGFEGLRLELRAVRSAIDELCRAIQDHSKAVRNPPQPSPVIVSYDEKTTTDTKTQQSRQYQMQKSIRNWTSAAVLAAIVYASIAALQWCEMQRANGLAQKANQDAWTLADNANQTAIYSERPWVGINIAIQNWTDDKTRKAVIVFTNSGRRPAKTTLVQSGSHDFKSFPPNPPYELHSPNVADIRSVALILPNGYVTNVVPLPELNQDGLNKLSATKKHSLFTATSNTKMSALTNSIGRMPAGSISPVSTTERIVLLIVLPTTT
jgi:hypothetical protein